jgi:hypothetical protein
LTPIGSKNSYFMLQYHMVMANSLFREEQGILPAKPGLLKSPRRHRRGSSWGLWRASCSSAASPGPAARIAMRAGSMGACPTNCPCLGGLPQVPPWQQADLLWTRSWSSHMGLSQNGGKNEFRRILKSAVPQITLKYIIIEYIVNNFTALRVIDHASTGQVPPPL